MEILHRSSNDLYLLPQDAVVLRVSSGPRAPTRTLLTQELTGWLAADHHFPTIEPVAGYDVVVIDETTAVGFWHYYPQRGDPQAWHLAALLRRLHDLPQPAHIPVPDWEPLASLEAVTTDPIHEEALTDRERSWILDQIQHIRELFSEICWPLGRGLIHGDAWAGNLLWGPGTSAVLLGDWDWASIGPRVIDLVPTWHATIRYNKSPQRAQDFAGIYGYDLAGWDHYPHLLRMRDFVQLSGPIRRSGSSPAHRVRLRQRLDDLLAGNTTNHWASA